jgi:hypothetical protein
MCHKKEESVCHLFTECDIVKGIREYIHDVTQVNQPPCAKYEGENIDW